MSKFVELMKAKMADKKAMMDDKTKKAHASILDDLEGAADDALKHKMQKVTVMAPDKAGLKKGLEKASEVVDKGPEMPMEEEESPEEEAKESPKEEESEDKIMAMADEISEDEAKQLIEKLKEKFRL